MALMACLFVQFSLQFSVKERSNHGTYSGVCLAVYFRWDLDLALRLLSESNFLNVNLQADWYWEF